MGARRTAGAIAIAVALALVDAPAALASGWLEGTPRPEVAFVETHEGRPGEEVIVVGMWLLGATQVSFGTAAATFMDETPESIRAIAPAGTGTVDVTVTTAAGTSTPVFSDLFTYAAPPPPEVPPQVAPAPTPPSAPPTSSPAPIERPAVGGAVRTPAAKARHREVRCKGRLARRSKQRRCRRRRAMSGGRSRRPGPGR